MSPFAIESINLFQFLFQRFESEITAVRFNDGGINLSFWLVWKSNKFPN